MLAGEVEALVECGGLEAGAVSGWIEDLFEELGGVVFGVDFGDYVGDGAGLVDDVGLAEGAEGDFAVVFLFAPGFVGLQDDGVGVRDEGEGEGVLGDEALVGGLAVAADSDDGVALVEEALIVVAEVAGFGGAAGGAVLGVEVEDELASGEIGEADGPAVLVGTLEVGGFVSCL